MTDTVSLLEALQGDDKAKAWVAVQALVNMRAANEDEAKARAQGCCALAEAHFARDKIGTAIDWWQEAINCDPTNPIYRLGMVARGLMPLGLHRQSLNEVSRAIKFDDKNPEAWRLLGHVHLAMRDHKSAIEAFDRQIELAPDNPVSYLDRTDVALELADWKTAEKYATKVLSMDGPQTGNALHQLGLMAFRNGLHEQAIQVWDKTLAHDCDNRELVKWNQSMALLSMGQYREGWIKHEYRGKQQMDSSMALQMTRGMPDRIFNNQPAPARLHVHQEMGYGDAIAMARYLPLLVEKGYDVRLEVMPSLVDLMQYNFPSVKVMPRPILYPGLFGVPEFDYHVPMLSLPRLFDTEVATIPWRGPYIKADPAKVREYRDRLQGRPAIGICWSSGIRSEYSMWLEEYGKRKSMKFDQLMPALENIACDIVNLTIGPDRKDNYWAADMLPESPNWDDTAALVECLDLVITVDTGLAHLVGAMGKPLWLMMHTGGSFHWMAERPGASWNERSPWYPSARLFRQKQPHEWGDVVKQVAAALPMRKAA